MYAPVRSSPVVGGIRPRSRHVAVRSIPVKEALERLAMRQNLTEDETNGLLQVRSILCQVFVHPYPALPHLSKLIYLIHHI